MPKFTMKALTEEDKKKDAYVPLEENMYMVEVESAEWDKAKVKIWQGRVPIETDEVEDRLVVTFKVLETTDGSAVKRIDGESIEEPHLKMFITERDLGWDKRNNCPKEGRALICALENLPTDAALEFDEETFIGKKVKCFVSVYTKGDGTQGNKMGKFKAIK